MRVISGLLRGRLIHPPSTGLTRPTADRVREAIFSILSSRVDWPQQIVLDAFAGTGAMGIEALSRGARHCTFVESLLKTFTVLQKNIDGLDLKGNSSLWQKDFFSYEPEERSKFSIAFIDPPYKKGLALQALHYMRDREMLFKDAFVCLELCKNEDLELIEGYSIETEKKYGQTKVLILKVDL
jgi:16S rRNA (guanine966-N2)-methyltransferase